MQEEWSYSFAWKPTRNTKKTVSGSGYSSYGGAEYRMIKARLTFGYRKPRWREWWRWGERKPRIDCQIKI